MKNLKKNIFIILLFSVSFSVFSEDVLLGAKDLLTLISQRYSANVKDFSASLRWIQDNQVQTGKIIFKNPQKMRMDFEEPKGQVIVTNGYEFWVYIEHMNLALHQELMAPEKQSSDNTAAVSPIMINPVGFERFLNDYAIEYHETKSLVKYNDGSDVYQFKLVRWRTSRQGFNVVFLTVQPNGIIRRVEGITAAYKRVVMEFDKHEINIGIPDLRFEYERPGHANIVRNFISKQGEN